MGSFPDRDQPPRPGDARPARSEYRPRPDTTRGRMAPFDAEAEPLLPASPVPTGGPLNAKSRQTPTHPTTGARRLIRVAGT